MSPAPALPPWRISQANLEQLSTQVHQLEGAVREIEQAEEACLAGIPLTQRDIDIIMKKKHTLARLATARTRLQNSASAATPTYASQYPSLEAQFEAIDLEEPSTTRGPPEQQFVGRYQKLADRPVSFNHFADTPKVTTKPRPRGPTYMAPTQWYLGHASQPPKQANSPRPLLLILDLNGCLGKRAKSGNKTFMPRPGLKAFMEWLNDPVLEDKVTQHYGHAHRGRRLNITVMIWTSAQQVNCSKMINTILAHVPAYQKGFVATWARESLGLNNRDFRLKVQVYKNLDQVWNDPNIQAQHPLHAMGQRWDQSNTLLLDDSEEKAASQPYNLINIPEFETGRREAELEFQLGENVLAQTARYIQHAMHFEDVSTWVKQNSFRDGFETPQ